MSQRRNRTIGVMTVATNIYLDYWKAMVLSADKVTLAKDKITFFVFTDNLNEVERFKKKLNNIEVRGFEILPYRWPEATLLRYQIFNHHIKSLNTDLLMHLDADMLFSVNPWNRIRNKLKMYPICLIEHPGFWRPTGVRRIRLYISRPFFSLRDLRLNLFNGGIGIWEKNPFSVAYVKRNKRDKYFCGGIWFGERESISKLVKNLSDNVILDLKQNIVAIWHDESHLNKWASENAHEIESPELCYVGGYYNLKELTPLVVAIEKLELTR